ncbi:MAG: serine/threonine protein kinase [Deltaproteobacteria bacterium]|nr:MAG: serine/threonine protein kinase [Deltaproteobacteria bacterium]
MNTERWYRMEVLFEQALERPESERDGFLDRACAGDLALRAQLEQMIADVGVTGDPVREAVVAEVELLAEETAASLIGLRLGPFRLVEPIGEGGMGRVYLAERDDAQFSQRVAIKVLRPEVLQSEAVARFHDERQILATLRHPNIVRLLDGGSTGNLPYLVLEYIEGTTITRYADQHQLSVGARVELVRQVCGALQYAHQNLIVHRDIKPSNVLVDIDGAPKILDFGIAKLLVPAASLDRRANTRRGFAMFTPEYAAPEQVRGDLISTATDIYSLGAVLYELVTGRSPHCLGDTRFEIAHTICEIDPDPPSLAGPIARRRELAGDLDNIILKALHMDPAHRYASMAQLSDDLGRWRDGLPVAARTSTFGYRARKFVRRNKGMVVAAAVIAATLLGATFVSLRQARRADEQAIWNEKEMARSRQLEMHLRTRIDELEAQAGRCTAQPGPIGPTGRAEEPAVHGPRLATHASPGDSTTPDRGRDADSAQSSPAAERETAGIVPQPRDESEPRESWPVGPPAALAPPASADHDSIIITELR